MIEQAMSLFTFANIIYVVYALNIVIAIGIIFFDKKSPTSTLAWIMILFLLPVVGLILYLVFSQNIARLQIYKLTEIEGLQSRILLNTNKIQIEKDLATTDNDILHKWKDMIAMNVEYAESILTYNSDAELICDGQEMFERLFNDIRDAKYTIKLQYFIVQDDYVGRKLINLLTQKAAEGVYVRLLIDAMGSRHINDVSLAEFKAAGGEYAYFFRPKIRNLYINFNYRNHRKMAIIDNEIGYIGGFNIGKEYIGKKKKFGYWRDTQLIVRGNALVSMNEMFYLDWRYASGETDINSVQQSVRHSFKQDPGNIPIQIIPSGPESDKEEIKRAMMKMISGARKSIYIQTPYLVPDEPMIESLAIAAQSGIDVRIMIPCMPDHMFVYRATLYNAGRLISEGAKVYIYENGFLHAKTLSVDGEVFTTGSSNFDIRSFRLNFESNAFIYDETITSQFDKEFEKDMKLSRQYTAEDRANISLIERILESISRLLTEIL